MMQKKDVCVVYWYLILSMSYSGDFESSGRDRGDRKSGAGSHLLRKGEALAGVRPITTTTTDAAGGRKGSLSLAALYSEEYMIYHTTF